VFRYSTSAIETILLRALPEYKSQIISVEGGLRTASIHQRVILHHCKSTPTQNTWNVRATFCNSYKLPGGAGAY
jgi:hypothetical protein